MTVEVAMNGRDFTSGGPSFGTTPSDVISVIRFGAMGGGTVMSIFGRNFVNGSTC